MRHFLTLPRLLPLLLPVLGCATPITNDDPSTGDWDNDGYTGEEGDCANENADWNPGAEDTVGDGIDQNCDLADGVDGDGDGYASIASGGDDCDDTSRDVKPGAGDAYYDGIDSDCAGDDDYDRDGDGLASSEYGGEDCDDYDAEIPGVETWNQIDDNCDGCIDEIGADLSYMDDGSGNALMVVTLTNADPHGVWMGLAETSLGGAGWYGEDCSDGATNCHPMPQQGKTLGVVYDTADVWLGNDTYFDEGRITGSAAVFWDSEGTCTAMGEGADYYASAGCCVLPGW